MLIRKLFALTMLSFTALPLTATSAKAQSSCDGISDPYRRSNCYSQEYALREQQTRWNSYTPRQRYLAQAVSRIVFNYYQRTGRALPVTQQTVLQVMQLVGASRSEAGFVIDRMNANNAGVVGINRANATLDRTQQFLNCLQTRGTGCVP